MKIIITGRSLAQAQQHQFDRATNEAEQALRAFWVAYFGFLVIVRPVEVRAIDRMEVNDWGI